VAWELQVKRLGQQHRPRSKVRTYGTYQVMIDGVPNATLSGHICEARGPGDNTKTGKDKKRIEEGRYALSTQFERYKSIGYSADQRHPPAFRVLGTGDRTDILVHPAHDPTLYLSSIGCFNPTKPLEAADAMVFADSRARVVAMLDSLTAHDPDAFAPAKVGTNTPIKDAFIVIAGEPTTAVGAKVTASARTRKRKVVAGGRSQRRKVAAGGRSRRRKPA
jgi:hypothetical protein